MKFLIRLSLLLLLPSLALAQDPTTFPDTTACEARLDADGNCESDLTNVGVCVTGVVVAWKHFGARGPGAIYDPVSGCCISIFDIDTAADQAIGTEVEVCGWVGPFRGLDELVDDPVDGTPNPTVAVLSMGNPVPITLIRAQDLANDNPMAEDLESCLVQICGRFTTTGTFAGDTNYLFVDGSGSCTVRIDVDTDIDGTAIPTGPVLLTGVLGQFDGPTGGRVPCTGYQILPRSLTDVVAGDCTIAVEGSTWSNVKLIYRSR
jgi:hypothetical protein